MEHRASLLRSVAEVRVRMGCAGRVEGERSVAMKFAKVRNPAVLAQKIADHASVVLFAPYAIVLTKLGQ